MVEFAATDHHQIRPEILRCVVDHVLRLSAPHADLKGCTCFLLQTVNCVVRSLEKEFTRRLLSLVIRIRSTLNRMDELDIAVPLARKVSRPSNHPDIRRLNID